MQLRGQESIGNFSGAVQNNARNASYDLSADKVIVSDVVHTRAYSLAPQEICVIVSKEKVKIPDDFVAYALPKTSLCQSGLLTLNTGILDPGYEGLISTTAINFGKDAIEIRPGDAFLRIVFHQLKPVSPVVPPLTVAPNDQDYLKDRREDTRRYPATFLDIPGALEKFSSAITVRVLGTAGTRFQFYLALAALLFTGVNLGITWFSKTQVDSAGEKYVTQVRDITTASANNAGSLQTLNGIVQQQNAILTEFRQEIEILKTAKVSTNTNNEALELKFLKLNIKEQDLQNQIDALGSKK